jgi:hypothetical protein
MEMSQGNFLYSNLKQTKMSFFPSIKSETWGKNSSCLGNWYKWERGECRERVWEGEHGALCTHVCKRKNETCWNCFRNGGRKENGLMEGVNSSIIYLICCKNFCKYLNITPSLTIKKEKKSQWPEKKDRILWKWFYFPRGSVSSVCPLSKSQIVYFAGISRLIIKSLWKWKKKPTIVRRTNLKEKNNLRNLSFHHLET